MRRSFTSSSSEETEQIGRTIGADLEHDALVFLLGDLGAGKTTLVRGIAAALGADPLEVGSPTFAIIHEYDVPAGTVIHVDGYRLGESLREWETIGLPDLLVRDAVKLVEWPKEVFRSLATPDLVVTITADGDRRRIEVVTEDDLGREDR